MTKRPYRTMQQELDELERTDPAVAKAAADYDKGVKQILCDHKYREGSYACVKCEWVPR